ncbi:MAG: T9SS type A sorting domain-containing protein [Flavobacteriaceae bacterium]|nr:T9SS type A sorting domain-containing protein [Flavobacteriaceae bacterium]
MGTLTTTANQGIATFSNIQFSTASTYTLVATASGLSDATSNDIIVNLIPEMIYKHDFAATTTTPYTAIPTTLNTNLSASSWSNKNGLGTFSAANGIGNTSGSLSVTTINNTPYTLTFNVANGYSLSVTSFNLWRFSSQASNSISSITINGINIITGSISIPTGTNANSGTTLGQTNVASTISGLTGTITVEINLTNGGNGGSFRLDDFTLYGNVTCVQPAVYSVTGGGNGCATTGVPVGLSDSQIGVNYQLKNGSINIGTPIAGIGSAISFSNVTTDGNYTVVATNTNGTCNFTVNMTGSASVTTDPISAAGPVSTNQYICSGTQPTDISLATFTGNIQWQSSSNNVTFTNISGQTDATLSGSSIGILTSNKYYRAVVTSSNCSSAISDVVTVAISASPTILLGNTDATSPTATNFSIPFSVLTGNNLHYSINTVTPNPLPSFSSVNDEILGATPINVVIPQTLEGAYSFELSISDGTTGCTTKYPFQLNIVALNPGTIGTNQSVCINQLPNTIINNSSATGSGNITYTWMKSTTSIDSGYNIISNASSDSYAPEPLTQTTYFKRVANNGLETYESNPITISLNTLGTIGAINGINTVNGENTTTYSINPVTNASCYTWSLPAGMSIMSSNGNEIVVNIANSFIDGPISVKATNACSETETTSINVGKTLSSDSITISGPTNVCSLSNATYSVEAISGATYFWTLPTGMTLNSQANANTINVSFDPTFNMGGMSVIVTTSSNSVTPSLTIGRLDILGTISGPTNLCGLTSATYTIPTISGANAYNWTVPAGMTIVSGSTTNTITVNITGNVSGSIVLQASGTCGLSPFRTLKVDTNQRPLDISGPTSICGATTTTICNGGLSSSSIPTNEAVYTVPAIIGATSYTWSTPTGTTIQSGQGTNSIKVLYDLTSFSSGLITVASNTNCGTSALRTIEIGTARTIITGPTSLCDLTTATYAIPSTIGTNFMWTLPSCMTLLSGQSLTNNSITVAISGPICSTQTLSVAITGSCGPTNNITLQVSCSKYSKIQNSQNGVVVSSNIPVYADAITGGLGYRFKVYNTDGFVATIDKPSRYFYFNEIAGISYGKTYAVEVAVQTATSTYSDYGYGCPTTVILNGTKIQSSQCGTIMANNLPIYADNVVGAIGYKFEISDAITGSIIATINKTTRYFYFNEITGLSFGNTYNIRVAVKNPNGTYSPFGSSCAVTLQNTKIQSSICGTTVASNTPIYVDTVVGATGYKFEISNNVGTVIATLNKTSNFFYFSEIANSSFGATYQVRVAVKNVDNTTYGTFGASCLISLQTTKIQAIQCGTTVASTTPIYVDSVVGATGYKFEISNNAGTVIATVNKTSNFFNFNEIANTSFGATYQVRVAPKNSDNATYGAFGSSCQVSLQTTQIQAIQCGTTVVNTSLVYADALSGATGYKFEISNNLGTVIATLNKTTRFFTFTEITNATINTTYYIRVAPKNPDNTTFGTYGSSCAVTSQIQNTKVQASQCGTIIANNLPIYADAVTAAVGYRFEISNNSGSVIATLDKSNRYFYFNEIANLSFGETYTIKVAPKNPDGISFGLFGASCNVTLQTSKIEAAICGTSMASNLPVYAENIASATGYRFEISNNSGAVIATLDKSTRYFYFNEISGVAFGTNYSIRVAPKNNNGLTYGLYGTACSVSLQGTKIQDSQCGSASAINLPIYADNVVGATGYRFEISNSTGNVITTLDKTNRYFYLNEISGVTFGTDYYVRVAVKKPTANTYSSFGTNCIISTLKTKIQSGQCGTTLPTNLPVYADAVTGASGYKFEISNASGTVITTINKTTRYFYFNEIPGVLNGTTYTVRVALKNPDNSSYSSYGISCNVTIGNTSAKTEIIEVTNKYEFAALAYPNPFEDNFKLLIKTANEKDDLHIKIYDMLGKQIGNEIVTPTEIEFYEFGKELASGVYNISISQGESNKTLRIIKR